MLPQLAFKVESLSAMVTFIHVFIVMVPVFDHCCRCVKCFSHMSHCTGGWVILKCSFTSRWLLKIARHFSQGNFRVVLTYFRFSLYSTVTNVFFFLTSDCGSFCGVPLSSILTAVPIIDGCDGLGGSFG